MIHPTSFYTTVSSNADLNLFPENRSSEFKNKIIPSILLDNSANYECGVESIYAKINPKDFVNSRQKIVFDEKNCEIEIDNPTVVKYSLQSSAWSLIGVTPNRLFAALTAAATSLKHLSFTQNYNSDSNFFVTLQLELPSNHLLFIDPSLSKLLGFEQYVFSKNGTYNGKVFTQTDVNQYQHTSFEIAIVKLDKIKIKISEPDDDSLDALSGSINEAFDNGGVSASFTISDDEEVAQIVVSTPFMKVKFPQFLLNALQLPSTNIFKEGTHIVNLSHLKLDNQREHLLLCCDIVEERHYCGAYLPILRVIPTTLLEKSNYLEFHPIQYLPVTTKTISEISFKILNDKLLKTKLGNMPVSITLRIKAKDEV